MGEGDGEDMGVEWKELRGKEGEKVGLMVRRCEGGGLRGMEGGEG